MTNTNCLEGIRCPECGQDDRFWLQGQSLFTLTDEGTEEHGDVEYDDGSYCECPVCDHSGFFAEFHIKEAAS